MLYAGAAAICRRLRHAAPAGCTQSLRRPAVPLALLGGAALGMGLGLGAVTAPVSAAGTAKSPLALPLVLALAHVYYFRLGASGLSGPSG